MATGRNKCRFEEFYGDIESTNESIESLGSLNLGEGSSFTADKSKTSKGNISLNQNQTFKDLYGDLEERKVRQSQASESTVKGNTPAEDLQSDKSQSSDASTKFNIFNVEHPGGPKPQLYRRPYHLARKMVIQPCPDGEKVKRVEDDVLSSPSDKCKFCRKTTSTTLKRCSRCLAVSYCNIDCQKSDFSSHKLFCRRCERYDIARARVYPAVRFFYDLDHGRDFSVILRDMPVELQYQLGARCNLLVEFLGKVFHFCRYSCLVRDLSGETTKIIFHDQTNLYSHPVVGQSMTLTHSLESCLMPGHFLLLLGVHWRLFMDGTVGIRVNDLNSIYIIDMADQHLPQKYREEMMQQVAQFNDSVHMTNISL